MRADRGDHAPRSLDCCAHSAAAPRTLHLPRDDLPTVGPGVESTSQTMLRVRSRMSPLACRETDGCNARKPTLSTGASAFCMMGVFACPAFSKARRFLFIRNRVGKAFSCDGRPPCDRHNVRVGSFKWEPTFDSPPEQTCVRRQSTIQRSPIQNLTIELALEKDRTGGGTLIQKGAPLNRDSPPCVDDASTSS